MKKDFSIPSILRLTLLTVILSLFALNGIAQPGDPQGGVKPEVPISGIEILVGMGILLGFRRLVSKNSRKL